MAKYTCIKIPVFNKVSYLQNMESAFCTIFKTSAYTVNNLLVDNVNIDKTNQICFVTYISFFFSFDTLFYMPYHICIYWFGQVVSSLVSLIVSTAFFGSLQLMILGITKLYFGKLYMQGKGMPMNIINKKKLT
jgi:polyisoprenyl-phosphate glycosyltransferase